MHVESQLSELLIYFINKYERIALKDIGVFHNSEETSRPGNNDTILFPPLQNITFSSLPSMDDDIVKIALSEELINLQESEQITDLIKSKSLELKESGSITIGDFGRISMEEGVPFFVLNSESAWSIGHYLPSVQINEVLGNPNEVSISQKVIEDEAVFPISSMKGQKIASGSKSDSWLIFLWPLTLLSLGILSMILIFKYCAGPELEVSKPDRLAPSRLDLPFSDFKAGITNRDTLQSAIFDSPVLNKYKHILTQEIINDGCKIVVGSFKNSFNASKMSERLATQGYQSTVTEFEDGLRVVITFDCQDYDLIEYLQAVRKDVSPTAWYIQPEFEPDLAE